MAITWLATSMPTWPSSCRASGAGGHARGRLARARALEHVAHVVVAVLERAGEIGVAGTRPRDRRAVRAAGVGGRAPRPGAS